MAVNFPFPPLTLASLLPRRPYIVSKLNPPEVDDIQYKKIDWKQIAAGDSEVRALLAAGFRFYSNYSNPENPYDQSKAAEMRENLDEAVERLTVEFGPGGVCVTKNAYDTSGRPCKSSVAIWVCDVKADAPVIKKQEEPSRTDETNGRRFFL